MRTAKRAFSLMIAMVFVLSLASALAVLRPEKAEAAPCTAGGTPLNVFPRSSTGLREDYGCTSADSYVWLSNYWSTSGGGGSPLHTPTAIFRIFFTTEGIAAAGGNLGTVTFDTDPFRFRCGANITVSINNAAGNGLQSTTWAKNYINGACYMTATPLR
jgi:hypothetical protein